jgi:hypothetical protein
LPFQRCCGLIWQVKKFCSLRAVKVIAAAWQLLS